MSRTLVLRFDAPFQSWGVDGKGPTKPTQKEPTLSGVVGLIANALGLRRHDDLGDLADLDMGSRTDRAGILTRDFYSAGTTTGIAVREESVGPDGSRTFRDTISKDGVIGVKHYLSGAVFTVALSGDAAALDHAADALLHPVRALYLGRRSCPVTRPPFEAFVEADAEDVLRTYPLDDALTPAPGKPWRAWHADASLRLVLPAQPDDPAGLPRRDRPPRVADPTRPYLPRPVRIEHLDRESLMPTHEEVLA